MKVLVLNSGSSSQKSSVYEIGETAPEDPPNPLWQGKIEWNGEVANAEVRNARGAEQSEQVRISSRAAAVEHLLRSLWRDETRVVISPAEIDVVGHRVVHGGPKYNHPVLLNPELRGDIAKLAVFAPLHNRAELDGVELVEKLLGAVPQVAVFDTAFHCRMPMPAAVYPGPYQWFESGIHRYGFHGINHQYCATRAAHLLRRELRSLKLVSCHLGNGCSLAAIQEGRSIDTTMGFTPLEGLMMGSRSGSIDPGILIYLMRERRLQAHEIDDVLNKESGLLGISGISADMRQIFIAMKQGHSRAKLAFDIYVHRLQAGIGAMIAVLGGVDALVFTGGVGENSPELRDAACKKLAFLGLELEHSANAQGLPDRDVATRDSAVRVFVIRAQEEWAIAKECWRLTFRQHASGSPSDCGVHA